MTELVWHGHACFELVSDKGLRIVVDPHDGYSIGLKPPSTRADIVLVTHDHYDHNAVEGVASDNAVIRCCLEGEEEIQGVRIKGFKLPHDKYEGRRRGWVHAYLVEVDGFRVLHLSDTGVVPSLELLGDPHVLLVPVGGTYTIGPDEAWSLVSALRPPVTIPMHYWVPGMMMPLDPIDEFLKFVKKIRVIRVDDNRLELSEAVGRMPGIFVLRPP